MKRIMLLLMLSGFLTASAQNPLVIKTVNNTNLEPSSDALLNRRVKPWNSKIFYQGKGSSTECNLVVTDGTTAGTAFVKNLGAVGDIDGVYPATDFVYITTLASEIVSTSPFVVNWKRNLWKTDGTSAGTSLLKDFPMVTSTVNTGIFHSNAQLNANLSIDGNTMYFNGYDATNGAELWKTDGTVAGTILVKDIFPGTTGGGPTGFCKVGNSTCFFARDAANIYQLWKTDGTAQGTQPVTIINPAGAIAEFYSGLYNGRMYFFANDGVTGAEVWSTDGTAAGTQLLKDIVPGNNAATGTGGLRTDILFIQDDNYLYFPIERSKYVWRTDGTTAGTIQLSGLMSSANIAGAVARGKYLYWLDNTSTLYKTDGSVAGTTMAKNNLLQATQLYSYRGAAWMNSRGYANNSDAEPWRSDGTAANTARALDVYPGSIFGIYYSSDPFGYFEMNGYLYFFASNGTGKHLFRYNGDMTFNGSLAGDRWRDSSNWNSMMPPGITDTATIPAGLTVNVDGAKAYAGTLLMGNGSSVNLATVTDSLFINAEINGTSATGNGVTVLRNSSGGAVQLTSPLSAANVNVQGAASLSGHLFISNSLNLTNSARLAANNSNVVLSGSSSSVTANNNNYIVTNSTGSLVIENIGTGGRSGNVTFPIGSSTYYNPATITNSGQPDAFSARVANGIHLAYSGDTPSGGSLGGNAVNATWFITEQTPGASNAGITLEWSAAQELPGFNRSTSTIGHYTNGSWQSGSAGIATGTDPYSYAGQGYTSFSPFSIINSNATLAASDIQLQVNRVGSANQLQWRLLSSAPATQLQLQRSKDGFNFSTVYTALPAIQSFTDVEGFANMVYYRLRAVWPNGSFQYSNTVWVKAANTATEVYPSIVSYSLYVQHYGNAVATFRLFSADGKMLLQRNLQKGTNLVDVSSLHRGTMFYSISTASQELTTGKLMKQ